MCPDGVGPRPHWSTDGLKTGNIFSFDKYILCEMFNACFCTSALQTTSFDWITTRGQLFLQSEKNLFIHSVHLEPTTACKATSLHGSPWRNLNLLFCFYDQMYLSSTTIYLIYYKDFILSIGFIVDFSVFILFLHFLISTVRAFFFSVLPG